MDANTSAAISAIVAAFTAVLTLGIAWANFSTARTDAKSSDFENCLDVVTKLAEAQRLVRDADNEEAKRFEFRELLNLMEALALLENHKKIAPSTRKFTKHFLIEGWAFLRTSKVTRELLSNSVTGAETFIELTKFAEEHKAAIERLTKIYERQLSQGNPIS